MRKEKAGFSLIELIVVIAVIGVVASMAVGNFSGMRNRAQIRVAKGMTAMIMNALEMYSNENLAKQGITPFIYPSEGEMENSAPFDVYNGEKSDLYLTLSPYLATDPITSLYYEEGKENEWINCQVSSDFTSYTFTVRSRDTLRTPVTAIRQTTALSPYTDLRRISGKYGGEEVPYP